MRIISLIAIATSNNEVIEMCCSTLFYAHLHNKTFKLNPQPVVQVKINADREWLTIDAFPIVILQFSTHLRSLLERDGMSCSPGHAIALLSVFLFQNNNFFVQTECCSVGSIVLVSKNIYDTEIPLLCQFIVEGLPIQGCLLIATCNAFKNLFRLQIKRSYLVAFEQTCKFKTTAVMLNKLCDYA